MNPLAYAVGGLLYWQGMGAGMTVSAAIMSMVGAVVGMIPEGLYLLVTVALALSAMRLFKSFKQVTICSAVLSVICTFAGIIVSILAGTPVGSTIVAADVLAFLICSGAGRSPALR